MKINKKLLQLVAALWILVYHVWIPVSGSVVEQYILRVGYVGVDIFFFTAAYSLADKKIEYGSFVKDRFINIYLKFALLILFAVVYKKWKLVKTIRMFTGLDLFQRGGGAFLWFIPAIMIFYILYPFFLKWENKYKVYWVLLGWLLVSVALERGLGYTTIFIFTNRIPVMMAGYWYKTHKLNKWLGWAYLPIGFILLYFFGFTKRLSVPIWDIYFVVGIVSVLGLTFASGYIKENKTVSFLGSATIEMYGFQMIFGTKLSGNVYKFMGNMLPGGANLAAGTKLLSNIVTILIIWALSLACSKVFALVKNAISQKMAALK